MNNLELALKLLPPELLNTLYMVFFSTLFAILIGGPIGIMLALTDRGEIKENYPLYKSVEILVNIGRSFPFAILMIALIPFTRLLIGTSLGKTASIVPLTIAAAPFFARLMETSLKEVDRKLIEAATVMGASTMQLIRKVLLREALPSILSAVTLTFINLIGLSTMAGLIGGGGLGQVAIQYGYHRFNSFIMFTTVALLIVLVQLVQWIGSRLERSLLIKWGKITRE